MRLTVAAETPTSAAICAPVWRCLRKASTAAQTAGAVWLGDERGFDERSCKPATPSPRKRPTHLATVFGVVLNCRAAAAFDRPPSITLRAIASRPFGVRDAFWCVHSASPRITEVWRHQRSRLKPNGQPPESSHLAVQRHTSGWTNLMGVDQRR